MKLIKRQNKKKLKARQKQKGIDNVLIVAKQNKTGLKAAQKLELRVNIYNVLNANTEMNVNKRSGPTFLTLQPTDTSPAIMEPRIYEVSVGFTF